MGKKTQKRDLLALVVRWFKESLIKLSRFKDISMMMILFNLWPEQTYRFSTRKFLPSKKNRFRKELRPTIPYDFLKNKSNNIQKMKEINIIARGASFNLNDIQNLNGPIFLSAFWSALKIDNNGKIFYEDDFSYDTGIRIETEKYLFQQSKSKDYKNKNITYVMSRTNVLDFLKKRNHNTLSALGYYENKKGDLCPFGVTEKYTKHLSTKDFESNDYNYIGLVEKIYKPPLEAPYLYFAPTGSVLPTICALSYFAEKINVYGWDFYLKSSPRDMSYWELFFNMYRSLHDDSRSNNHFESALLNFYYGYQFSKLPNFKIHGYLGQLEKHEKLIKRIEKVLFQ